MGKIRRIELIVARKKKKLSQYQVGKLIGITQTGYSKIENGLRNPSLEQSKILVKELNIDISIL